MLNSNTTRALKVASGARMIASSLCAASFACAIIGLKCSFRKFYEKITNTNLNRTKSDEGEETKGHLDELLHVRLLLRFLDFELLLHLHWCSRRIGVALILLFFLLKLLDPRSDDRIYHVVYRLIVDH